MNPHFLESVQNSSCFQGESPAFKRNHLQPCSYIPEKPRRPLQTDPAIPADLASGKKELVIRNPVDVMIWGEHLQAAQMRLLLPNQHQTGHLPFCLASLHTLLAP